MIRLSDMIPSERILDLDDTDHHSSLAALIKTALPRESDQVRAHVQEEIDSKCAAKEINLGKGFALSHARLDGINDIEIAVGLFHKPTRYLKGDPVHTVFCIMIPPDKAQIYLTLMARLARFLLQPGVEDVFLAGDHERIREALAAFDAE